MTNDVPRPPAQGPLEPPEDAPVLTDRDRSYMQLYLRLLDADAAGVDWKIAARDILALDLSGDCACAKRVFDRFLARAKWMTSVGYKLLLDSGTR